MQTTYAAVAPAVRRVYVEWTDEARMISEATPKGWTEGASLADFIDMDAFYESREFPSVTKAKAWAVRNRKRDVWSQPEVTVYEWPDSNARSWERERVVSLRYQGDGDGWEEMAA